MKPKPKKITDDTPDLIKTKKIQEFIDQGKQVVMKKPDTNTLVVIVYNPNEENTNHKWMLLLDGNKFFVEEIIINTQARTASADVEGIESKNHVICMSKEIIFTNRTAILN